MTEATYVYCVVHGGKKALARAPKGLAGTGKPRVLPAGDDLALVVATAPLPAYAAETIDAKLRDLDWVGARAAEHEAVVEHAATLGTVVPMKLFTLFASDDRAVGHVTKIKKSLGRVIERIEGCEEWGLRILLDETRAAKAAAAAARSVKPASGKDFLLRKKALDTERREHGARGAAEAEALYDRVAGFVRDHLKRSAPNRELAGRVIVDAAFLVPHGAVERLKETVAASADALVAEGFDISLTGPWPAYSFIDR